MPDDNNEDEKDKKPKPDASAGSDQQDAADAARQARVLESSGVRQEDINRQTSLTRQAGQDDFERNIATAGTLATGRNLLEGWRQGDGRPEAVVPGQAGRPSDAAVNELRSLMRHHGTFAADRQSIRTAELALQANAKDLPEAQRAAYQAIGSALVKGDAAALEKAMKQFSGDPKQEADFKAAMDALGRDLGKQGIKLDYQPGAAKDGDKPATPGALTVKRDGDDRTMTVRSDGSHTTTRPGTDGQSVPLNSADDRQFMADTARTARQVGKVGDSAPIVPADGARTTEESVVNPRTGEKEKVAVRTTAIDGKSVEQKMYPDGRIETAINTAGGGDDKRNIVRSVYNPGPPPSMEVYGKDGKRVEINNETPIARDGKVAVYADGRTETTITDDPKRVKTIDFPPNDPQGRGRTTEFRPESNSGLKTETVMRDGTVQREGRDARGDYKSTSWNDPDAGQVTQTFYKDGSVVTTKDGKVVGADKPVAVAKSKDEHGRDVALMSDGRTITDLGDGKRQIDYPENNLDKKISEVRDDKAGVTATTYGDRIKYEYDKGDLASRTVFKDVKNGVAEERQFRGEKGNRSESDIYKDGVKVETRTQGKDDIGEYQGRQFKDADGKDVTQQFYTNGTVKTVNAKGETVVQKPGEEAKEVGTVRGADGAVRKLMSDGSARRETEQGTETLHRDGRTELAFKTPQDAKALGLAGEGTVTRKTAYPADDAQGRTERFDFAPGTRGDQTSETRVKGADGNPSGVVREYNGNGADGRVLEREANGKVVEKRFADGRFVNTPENGEPSSGRRQEFANKNGEKGSIDVDDRTGRVVGMRFTEGTRAGQEYKFGYDEKGKMNSVTLPDGRIVKPGADGRFDAAAMKAMGFSLGEKDSKDGKFEVRVNNKGELVATNGDSVTQYLRTNGSRDTFDDKNYSRVREGLDGTKTTDYWDGYGWRQPKNVRTEGAKTIVEFDQMQGRPRTIERDSTSNQLKVKFGDGSSYEADWQKQQQTYTDASGKKTTYFNTGEVGQGGDPVWRRGTAGQNGEVNFAKDASREELDKMRRGEKPMAATIGPDGSVTSVYANGTKVVTDGKGKTKSVDYANGQKYKFEHDADGRINSVVAPDGTIYARRGDQAVGKDGQPTERWTTFSGQPPRETGTFDGTFNVKGDGTVEKRQLDGNSTTHEPNGRSITRNKLGEEIQITEANGNRWIAERVPGTGASPENANKRVWKLAGDDKVSFTGERKLQPDGSVSFVTAEGTFKRNADKSTSRFEKSAEVERRYDNGGYITRDAKTGLPSEMKDADGNVRQFNWGQGADGKPVLKEVKVTGPDGKPGISEMPDSKGVLRQVVKPDAKDDERFGAEVRYGGDGSRTTIQADKSAVKKNTDGSEFRFDTKGDFAGATIRKPDGVIVEINDKQQVSEARQVVPGGTPPEKVVAKANAEGVLRALDDKGEPTGAKMVVTDKGFASQVADGHYVADRPDGTREHLSPTGEFMYSTDKDGKRLRVSDGRGGEARMIYDEKGVLSKIEYRSPDFDGVRTTNAEGTPKTGTVQFSDRKEIYDQSGKLLRQEFVDKSSIDFDAASGLPTKTRDVYGTERTFKPAGKWPPAEVEVRKPGQQEPSIEKMDNGRLREWDAANKRFGSFVGYDALTGTRFSNTVDGTGKLTGVVHERLDGTTIEQRGEQRIVRNRFAADKARIESSKPPEPVVKADLPPDVMAIVNAADKALRERPELEKALRGTSEAGVNARTGDGATLEFQRKALEAQARLLPEAQRAQVLANMKEFEARAKKDGLTDQEVAKTYFQANRLFEARPAGDTITAGDTARAAQALLHGAARPSDTNQGFHQTCNVTTTREALLSKNPSLAGQVAADIMTSKDGTFVAPDGQRIRIDQASLRADKESLVSSQNEQYSDRVGMRDQLGQVLDHAFTNYAHQKTYKDQHKIAPDKAVDQAFYTQDKGTTAEDTGERLNRPGKELIKASHVNTDQIADLATTFLGRNNVVTNGDTDPGSTRPIKIASQAELEKTLTEGLRQGPMTLLVHTGHPSINGHRDGGPHVFTVTDTKSVSGETFFRISDQAGSENDKWISAKELFNATQDSKSHHHGGATVPREATTPGDAGAGPADFMPPADQRPTSDRVKELFGDTLKVDAGLAAPYMAAKNEAERAAALQGLAQQAANGNRAALEAARQLMVVDAALALRQAEGGIGWQAEDAQKQAVMRLANLSATNQAEGKTGTADGAGEFLNKWIGDDVKRQSLVERSEAAVEQLRKSADGQPNAATAQVIAEARAEFLKQSGSAEGREQALKRIGELQAQSLLTTGGLNAELEAERAALSSLSKAMTDAKGGALPLEAAATLQQLMRQNPDIAYRLNPEAVPGLRESVEAQADAAALRKFDAAVERAKQEVVRETQSLSDAMGRYLDRTASGDQRREALQQIEQLAASQYGPSRESTQQTIATLQGLDKAMSLEQATRDPNGNAAQVIAAAQALRAAATGNPPNAVAQQMLAKLGDTKEVDRLLGALGAADAPTRQAAMEQIQNRLRPAVEQTAGEKRVERLTKGLHSDSPPEDLRRAAEILRAEVRSGNGAAKDWSDWAGTIASLGALKEAKTPAELRASFEGLAGQAFRDNAYAKAALAGLLSGDGKSLDVNGKQVKIPGFEQLSDEGKRALHLATAAAIESQTKATGGELDKQTAEAVASALAKATANGDTDLQQQLLSTIESATKGPGKDNMVAAMARSIAAREPGASSMTDAFLKAASADQINKVMPDLMKSAAAGDATSLRIISSAGRLGDLAKNIATAGGDLPEPVREAMHQGLKSESRAERADAAAAMATLSKNWNELDMHELKSSMSPELATALSRAAMTKDGLGGHEAELVSAIAEKANAEKGELEPRDRQAYMRAAISMGGAKALEDLGLKPEVQGDKRVFTDKDGTKYEVSSTPAGDRIQSMTDAAGNRSSYDGNGNLTRVARADGGWLNVESKDGVITRVSDIHGNQWEADADGKGWHKNASTERATGALTVNSDGTYSIGERGDLYKADGTASGDRKPVEVRNANGDIVELTNSLGEKYQFGYSAPGQLDRVTYPDGSVAQRRPDGAWDKNTPKTDSRPGSWTRVDGISIDKATGKLTIKEAVGYTTENFADGRSRTFNTQGRLLVERRPDGSQVRNDWDGNTGALLGRDIVSPDGTKEWQDATGARKITAPDGSVTRYDAAGQLTDVQRKEGPGVHVERDASGIKSIAATNGIIWDRTADGSYTLRGSNPPQLAQGEPFVKPNGDFGFKSPTGRSLERVGDATVVSDGNKSLRFADDGSSQIVGKDGRINASQDARGVMRSVVRDENDPNKIKEVKMGDTTFTRTDGNLWRSPDGKELRGEFQMDERGNFSFTDATNKLETVYKPDGSTVIRSSEGNKLVHRTETSDGRATDYYYNSNGRLIGMRTPDGASYTRVPDDPRNKPGTAERWSKDGTTEIREESRSVDADGNFRLKPAGANETIRNSDGWEKRTDASGRTIFARQNEDKSIVIKNAQGQIEQSFDPRGGNQRTYGYDAQGQLNSVTYGGKEKWSLQPDGKTWSKEGANPPESWQGKMGVTAEGSLVESRTEGGINRETVRKSDGSILRAENGRFTSITRADGSSVSFGGFDAQGKPNKVSFGEDKGAYWSTTNGTDWSKFGADGKPTGETNKFSLSVGNDGSVTRTNLGSSSPTLERWATDGTAVIAAPDGRKLRETKPNGTTVEYKYDGNNQFTGKTETKAGTVVETDARGRVTHVKNAAVDRSFEYSERGEIKAYTEGGKRFELKEGTRDVYVNKANPQEGLAAQISVRPDGTMQTLGRDNTQTFFRLDGTTLTQRADGAMILRDNIGRVSETVQPNGYKMRYEYGGTDVLGREGGLRSFTYGADGPNPVTYTTGGDKPGFIWTRGDGKQATSFIRVDQNTGAMREYVASGDIITRNIDGTESIGHKDLDSPLAVLREYEEAWFSGKKTREEKFAGQIGDKSAEDLYIMSWKYNSGNTDALRAALVKVVGGDEHFRGVHIDGLFKRRDRPTDDLAVRLMVNRAEQNHWWISRDRSRDEIRQDDLNILGSANEQTRVGIDNSLRGMYQISLQDQVRGREGDQFYQRSLELYSQKGRDIRTVDEQTALMDLALRSSRPLDNFMIAAGENIATDDARKKFKADGGSDKITAAFTRTEYDEGGGSYEVTDRFGVKQATDYMDRGKLRPQTAIEKATGVFSNSDEVVRVTLQNMSKQDQDSYFDGRALATSGTKREAMTDAQRQAFDFYNEVQSAVKGLHWFGKERKAFGYEAQIGRRDGEGTDLSQKLVEIGGHWTNDHQENLSALENMSRASFDRLMDGATQTSVVKRGDKEYKSDFQADLLYGMEKNLGSGDYLNRASNLLNDKLNFGLRVNEAADTNPAALRSMIPAFRDIPEAGFKDNPKVKDFLAGREVARAIEKLQSEAKTPSEARQKREEFMRSLGRQGELALESYRQTLYDASKAEQRRPLLNALQDNTGTVSNDRQAMWDAVKNMSSSDRQRYHDDADYRAQIKQQLDNQFRTSGPARQAVDGLLQQIENDNGKPPKSPSPSIVDELNARAGLKGINAHEAYNMVNDALKSDPALRERLQKDEGFRKQFEEAAKAAAGGGDANYQKYIQPLIDKGGLSPAALRELNTHIESAGEGGGTYEVFDQKGYFKDGVLNASPAALARLKENKEERDALLANITDPKLHKLAEGILTAGEVRPEARVRAFVLDAGATKDDVRAALSVDASGKPLSEAERVRISSDYNKFGVPGETANMRNDVLDKVDPMEKPDFLRLTRDAEWTTERTLVVASEAVDRANSGWIAGVTRDYNIMHEEQLRAFWKEKYEANQDPNRRDLSPEDLERQWKAVDTATRSFHMDKEATAETVVNGVIMAGSIVAAPFTGGTSLAAILATGGVVAAGGVIGAGLKYGMLGDTHKGGKQLAEDFAKYSIITATNLLGPEHLAAAFGLGAKAGTAAAERALADAAFAGMSAEAKEAVSQGMVKLVRDGMAHGGGVADKAIQDMVTKLAQKELAGLSEQAQAQLAKSLGSSLRGAVDDVAKTTLRDVWVAAQNRATATALGTTAGVAGNVLGSAGVHAIEGKAYTFADFQNDAISGLMMAAPMTAAFQGFGASASLARRMMGAENAAAHLRGPAAGETPRVASDARVVNTGTATVKEGSMLGHGQADIRAEGPNTSLVLRESATAQVHDGAFVDVGNKAQATLHGKSEGAFAGQSRGVLNDNAIAVVSDSASVTANHNSVVQVRESVPGARPTVELRDSAAADIRSGAQVTANGPGTLAVASGGATNVDLTLNNGSGVFDSASGTVKGQGAVTVSGRSRVTVEVPEGQSMTVVVKGGDANVTISPNSKGAVRVVIDEGTKAPAGLAEHPSVKIETQKATPLALERIADRGASGVKDGAASPVDDLIRRYNSGDKTVTQAQVQDALLDYARKEMRRMGFGDNADALVTRDNLVLESGKGNSRGGYDPRTDIVGIGTRTDDGALPSKTLTHELRHRMNSFERTALQNADPEAFREALVDDVLANVGQGGQRIVEIPEQRALGGLWVKQERQLQLQDRLLATPQETEFMRNTLRQYLTEGKNGALGKPVNENELLDWMIKKDITVPGGDAVRGRQLVREMTAEINHANYVQRTSVISDAAIKGNPALSKALDDYAGRLQRMDADARQTQIDHFMRNRSLDTNALAGDSAANYYQFSTEEIRARRSEMSANLRQVNSDLQAIVKDIKEIEPKNIKGIRDNLETVRQSHPEIASQIDAKLKEMDTYAENIRFQNSMEKVNRAALELKSGKPSPGAQERLDAGIREVLQRTPVDQAATIAHHLYTQGLANGNDIMRLASADIAGEVANGLRVANPKQFTPQVLMGMSSDAQLFSVTSKLLEKKAVTVTDIMDAARGNNRMAAATAAVMQNTTPPVSLSSLAEMMNNKGRLSEFINGGIDGGAFNRAQIEDAIKAQNGSRHAKAMREVLDGRPAGNDPPVRDFVAERARRSEGTGLPVGRIADGDARFTKEALNLTEETAYGHFKNLDVTGKRVVITDGTGTISGTGIAEVTGNHNQTITLSAKEGDTLRVVIHPNAKGGVPNIVIDDATRALLQGRPPKAEIQILNLSSKEVPPGLRDRGSLAPDLIPLERRDHFAPLDTLRNQEAPKAFTPAQFDALTSRVESALRSQSDTIPLEQWQSMLKGLSPEDQALAAEIMRHSAPNMNRRTVDVQLGELGDHLKKNTDTIPPSAQIETKPGQPKEDVYTVYVPEGMADGKALAHLLDKRNNMSVRIEELTPETIKKIKDATARGELNEFNRTALILDDMSKFSPEQRAALQDVKNLVVADLGGFGQGVNMYDMASARLGGPEAVQAKLRDLVKDVRNSDLFDPKAPRDSVELYFEGRREVYQPGKDQNVLRIDRNPSVTRRLDAIDGKAYTPEQLMARVHEHATQPMVTKAEMEAYLSQVYSASRRSGQFTPERSLLHATAAARALEDGMQMHDYSNMMTQLRGVQDQILADMKRAGQGDHGIIIVSGTAELRGGELQIGRDGSGYLIEHLVSKAWKGEPKTQVMSIDQLRAMERMTPQERQAILGKNRLVLLDDYRLTGNQQGKTIRALEETVFRKLTGPDGKPLVNDISVGSLGEYYLPVKEGNDPMIKPGSIRVGQEILPGDMKRPPFSTQLRVHAVAPEHFTEFAGGLGAKGAARWEPIYSEMGIRPGWKDSSVGGSIVTPYGMPNNNPGFMQAATSGGFNMPDRYWRGGKPDSWNRLFEPYRPGGKGKIGSEDNWFLREKPGRTTGGGDGSTAVPERLNSQRPGDIDGLERARQMAAPKDQPDAPRRLNPDEFPKDMKVREGDIPAIRHVVIGGEQYDIMKPPMQSWWYGKFPDKEGNVKVHVTTDGAADLGRLQEALFPAFKNDPVLAEAVAGWKTFDPMIGTGDLKADSGVPNGQNQMAKGFTVYVKTPEEAARVQARIDQILHEKGLSLDRPIDSGNVDTIRGASNRVGIVRDMYEPTTLANNYPAAKLDAPLQDHIHAAMGLKPGERLSFEQLRAAEKRAGIMPETLAYNPAGELSLVTHSHHSRKQPGEGRLYLDESRAVKEPGKLTDRVAMYALTKEFLPNNADPADLARGVVASPPEFAAARARGERIVGPEKPPVFEKAIGENRQIKPIERLTLDGADIRVEPGGAEVPIGRHHQQYLDNRNVSRDHATIGRTPEGQYFIRDNGSTFGTFVKGPTDSAWRKVEGVYKLRGDERIMLGGVGSQDVGPRELSPANRRGTELKLKPEAVRPEPIRPVVQPEARPVNAVRVGNSDIVLQPGAEMPIGRTHQTEIENRNVSRNHAVVGRNADGSYYIRDDGSTNGTFVKGPQDADWRKVEGTYTLRGDEKVMLGGTATADGGGSPLAHQNRKGTELELRFDAEPPKKVFADGGIASLKIAGEHYDIKPGQEFLVGRTPENGMPLDVSRKHVYVGRDADGNYYLRAHENSTYGTYIKNPGDAQPRLLRPEDGNVRITAQTEVTVGKLGHKVEIFRR